MPHPPNIPLTRQTDDRNFPQHDPEAPWGQSGHPYPKRINREFMPEDVEPWRERHVQFDTASQKKYYNERCPQPRRVLTSGKIIPGQMVPVIVTQEMIDYLQLTQNVGDELEVKSAEEEVKAKGFLGHEDPAPVSVTALVQEDKTESQVERLKRQNAELEAELERNIELTQKIKDQRDARASLSEEVVLAPQPKKRGGRPKGSRNKPRTEQVVQSLTDIGSNVSD
jgi:hypothetical protein